jgi:hypothetical protein
MANPDCYELGTKIEILLNRRLNRATMSCRTRSGIQPFYGFRVKPGMTNLRYLITRLIKSVRKRISRKKYSGNYKKITSNKGEKLP